MANRIKRYQPDGKLKRYRTRFYDSNLCYEGYEDVTAVTDQEAKIKSEYLYEIKQRQKCAFSETKLIGECDE